MILPRDLRLRIVAVVGVVVILSPVSALGPCLVYLGLGLSLVLADPHPFPWRRLLHVEAFLILLLITLPLTVPGTPLMNAWGLTASREGLDRAIVVTMKVTAAMFLLTVGFARVEPARLAQALRGLRCPETLVRLMSGSIRYLGLLRAEVARLQDAMRMRSFRPRSNWHTWRSYGNLIGMVLLRAMARADRVEEAMRMRGYAGHFPAPALPAIPRRDWLVLLSLLVAAFALLIWDLR